MWTPLGYSGGFKVSTNHFDRTAGNGSDFGGNNITLGGNQPHNNLPPYTTAYIWKRTT